MSPHRLRMYYELQKEFNAWQLSLAIKRLFRRG